MSQTDPRDAAAQEAVRAIRRKITKADPATLDLLFHEARTHYGFVDKDVSEDTLREIYSIAIMGPTSMNQSPMRLLFVRSAEAKAKLKPMLMGSNQPKMMSAPVTAIIGHDMEFYEKLSKTFPHDDGARDIFAGNDELIADNAFRNGTLQAAYFMIAARAVGLDVGPMSGFDKKAVNEGFFAGTTVKVNFICNLGYGDEGKLFRRLPRLEFDEVAQTL